MGSCLELHSSMNVCKSWHSCSDLSVLNSASKSGRSPYALRHVNSLDIATHMLDGSHDTRSRWGNGLPWHLQKFSGPICSSVGLNLESCIHFILCKVLHTWDMFFYYPKTEYLFPGWLLLLPFDVINISFWWKCTYYNVIILIWVVLYTCYNLIILWVVLYLLHIYWAIRTS